MPPKDIPMPFRTALPWTGFVALLFLLNYMSRSTLTPLLVSIEEDLGIGHAQATSLLLMQSAGFSSALAASGFLLSRFKPRQIATIPLAIAGGILLLMPLVHTLGQARLVFIAFGLGVGFYFPAGMATLSSLVFPKDWGKAVAIHELAPNTGFILIPLLAQAGLMFTDWRGVFAIMGVLMICTAGAFLLWGRGGNTRTDAPSFKGCGVLLKNPASWIVALLMAVSMIGEFSIYSILQIFLVSAAGFGPEEANLGLSISCLLYTSPPPIIPQKLCEIRIQSGAAVGEHDLDVMHGAFVHRHDGERLPTGLATGHGRLRRRNQRIAAPAAGATIKKDKLHALRRHGLHGTTGKTHPRTPSTRLSPLMTPGLARPHKSSSVGAISPSLPPERNGTARSPSAPRSTTTSGT